MQKNNNNKDYLLKNLIIFWIIIFLFSIGYDKFEPNISFMPYANQLFENKLIDNQNINLTTYITRDEFINTIWKIKNNNSYSCTWFFKDVNITNKDCGYIEFLKNNNYISNWVSWSWNYFYPNNYIQRDNSISVLWKIFQITLTKEKTKYLDLQNKSWESIKYISSFEQLWILDSSKPSLFQSENYLTRWEFYKILIEIINYENISNFKN